MIRYTLGEHKKQINKTIQSLGDSKLINRFWKKDPSLWKPQKDRQKLILDRLGWVDIADYMLGKLDEIKDFVKGIQKDKFTHVVLLGMGGSSLCPDVLHQIFGIKKGYPKFFMLDSTDPEAVAILHAKLNLKKTLFIVSSKSGGTIEPNSQLKYFWGQVGKVQGTKNVGNQFCTITDPGTYMEQLAKDMGFRKIFLNPPDIGGRYSALSFFGIVPAALMGIDVKKFLLNANKVKKQSRNSTSVHKNPSFYPGVILGELAKQGIDKATFLIPGKLYPLGYWIEQLIAESTGKEGTGCIPIEGESIDKPAIFGNDRVFVSIQLKSQTNKSFDTKLSALKKAGFPVIEIILDSAYDLAGEFYRWEIATAVIGVVLGIDPFDQPNVQAAKDITNTILNGFVKSGKFSIDTPRLISKDIKVYFNKDLEEELLKSLKSFKGNRKDLTDILTAFFSQFKFNDYIAILAYLAHTDKVQRKFDKWREQLRKELQLATIQGYGPRYLHSIGQLYKGGPNSGLFLEITIDSKKDLKIPGEKYTFAQLITAQGLGDFQALQSSNRRAIRIHLGEEYLKNMEILDKAILSAIKKT